MASKWARLVCQTAHPFWRQRERWEPRPGPAGRLAGRAAWVRQGCLLFLGLLTAHPSCEESKESLTGDQEAKGRLQITSMDLCLGLVCTAYPDSVSHRKVEAES